MAGRQPLDCIVIGAGMSGLTFGALMAQAGKRVLVVEQHYLPGGLFTAFKEQAFSFNVGMEWTTDCEPGEPFYEILAGLGLADAYRFRKLSEFKSVLSPELRRPLRVKCSFEGFRRQLLDAFPHESRGIDRFLEDAVAVASDQPRAKRILFQAGIRPVEDMLAQYFDDPVLIYALFSLVGYPGSVGVLLMYIVGAVCLGQMYLPEHWDHRRLGLLLHRKLRQWGSDVRYRTSVERILIHGGEARGVQLSTGETLRAPLVVASVDAHQLYDQLLAGECSEEPSVRRQLDRKPGLSCFSLFLGLGSRPTAQQRDHYACSLLGKAERWLENRDDLAAAPLRVEHQSALHRRLAPAGKSTLCVWATAEMSAFDHWGRGSAEGAAGNRATAYQQAKSRATKIVMRRLEEFFPDLQKNVEYLSSATPFTYEAYTRNTGGSVSGFSLRNIGYLKQAGFGTPIGNLFHIGHWTVQSGVNSVMYSAADLFHHLRANQVTPFDSPGQEHSERGHDYPQLDTRPA